MIKVYGYPTTRSTRVTWALEEAHAEYEFFPINLRAGEHKTAEFLAINPFGKIPVLIDESLTITESTAICTYIAEKFPASGLIPSLDDAHARAQYHQWIAFIVSELETHLWTAAKHTHYLPTDKRAPAVVETCYWEFAKATEILANHLQQNSYITGNQFTAADILCTSLLSWAASLPISLHPALIEYKKRLSARPALKQARQREAESTVNR